MMGGVEPGSTVDRRAVITAVAAGLAAGCSTTSGGDGVEDTSPATTVGSDGGLALTSAAFADRDAIPTQYTYDGDDVSPLLSIAGVPDAATSLSLVVDDPDAPGGTFVHWLLWGLPPGTTALPENVGQARRLPELGDARQGTNGFGEVGYRGPRPPEGDGPHCYRFTLYALSEGVNVQASARWRALAAAMDGRVVETARLVGTYER